MFNLHVREIRETQSVLASRSAPPRPSMLRRHKRTQALETEELQLPKGNEEPSLFSRTETCFCNVY